MAECKAESGWKWDSHWSGMSEENKYFGNSFPAETHEPSLPEVVLPKAVETPAIEQENICPVPCALDSNRLAAHVDTATQPARPVDLAFNKCSDEVQRVVSE